MKKIFNLYLFCQILGFIILLFLFFYILQNPILLDLLKQFFTTIKQAGK